MISTKSTCHAASRSRISATASHTVGKGKNTMTREQIPQAMEFAADMTAAEVAKRYAEKKGISTTEGVRAFMATKTYALLINPKSYLSLESVEYVLDMLDAELRGDNERWLEI
jgi:hypothetical protein